VLHLPRRPLRRQHASAGLRADLARLPSPGEWRHSVIRCGPGTGIAPFRAFLEKRLATGAKGRNWLFFGDQKRATDFLYREQLEGWVADGHLTRLDLAFSRDQAEKIYVQDRMLERAAELWSWLESGAHFYVCGDAIVRHLDDQCIGCQYCVLKCPYDVPKYSAKRGIVRKCDMCHSRLAVGEAPACVQACPSGAITIRLVEKSAHAARLAPGDRLLPGAFDSAYTKPTTAYTSRRPIPANARPGDAAALRLDHAHWPLIAMLVLTQNAAGIFLSAAALALGDAAAFGLAQAPLAVVAFAILNLGLAVSVLHLGRPLGAWRAFLGLRTSWMSREILAFRIFAATGAAFTGASLWISLVATLPALSFVGRFLSPAQFAAPLAGVTAVLGLLGVYCSAMIYVDTRRVFWSRELTSAKFFGPTLLLGSAGAAAVLGWTGVLTGAPLAGAITIFAFVAALIRTALFGWEFQNLHRTLRDESDANHRSALVIWKLRRPLVIARLGLFAGSTLFGILAITGAGWTGAHYATLAFLLTLTSQAIERYFSSPPSSRPGCRARSRPPPRCKHEKARRQSCRLHPRLGRAADQRPRTDARRLRPRRSAGAAEARRHDHDGLRLLLHRLRAEHPSQRRSGDQSERRHALPREPRNGLPKGLGGAHAARGAGPRDHAAAAQRADR
jgi:DMSO reductase anchor subunit/ferredoxin